MLRSDKDDRNVRVLYTKSPTRINGLRDDNEAADPHMYSAGATTLVDHQIQMQLFTYRLRPSPMYHTGSRRPCCTHAVQYQSPATLYIVKPPIQS